MSITFVDEVSSDVSFIVESSSLNSLFEDAALGLMSTIADIAHSPIQKETLIELEAESEELLLMLWLNELVFLKDSKQILVSKSEVVVMNENNHFKLKAAIVPVSLKDVSSENLRVDVKAVTWHEFKIEKENGFFKAKIVVDV
jgi:SHS2 domain-containing protein